MLSVIAYFALALSVVLFFSVLFLSMASAFPALAIDGSSDSLHRGFLLLPFGVSIWLFWRVYCREAELRRAERDIFLRSVETMRKISDH